MILEEFEAYCRRHNITSEQYKADIFPHFAAGFVGGQRAVRRHLKNERTPHGMAPLYYNQTYRGNPK